MSINTTKPILSNEEVQRIIDERVAQYAQEMQMAKSQSSTVTRSKNCVSAFICKLRSFFGHRPK